MAEKAVQEGKTYIDPMFYLPPGVLDFTSDNTGAKYISGDIESPDETGDPLDASDTSIEPSDIYVVDESNGSSTETPTTPDILGVVSQVVRTQLGGSQVVDVVLEVSGPANARYQVRITKT